MADESSVNSLTSGKCLENLGSAYFKEFFPTEEPTLTLKLPAYLWNSLQ